MWTDNFGVWQQAAKSWELDKTGLSPKKRAVKELEGRGMKLVGWLEMNKVEEAQFHPKDAFGVMIEFCEYQEEHGASQAALGK